jgi:flagellar basal-body rod modification protein FlgD
MTSTMPTAVPGPAAAPAALPAGLRSAASGPSAAAETGRTTLGQADFLRLLTTQLQNQDPTAPLDNQAFVAQMAQFSGLQAMQQVAQGVEALGERLAPSRIATATSLIGKSVLVPGGIATRDASGGISGAVDLPAPADELVITIADDAGRPLRELRLGAQSPGLVGFGWDGRDANGRVVAGERFRVWATAIRAGQGGPAPTSLFGRVAHVDLAPGGEPSLGVAGLGSVRLDQVRQVRGH